MADQTTPVAAEAAETVAQPAAKKRRRAAKSPFMRALKAAFTPNATISSGLARVILVLTATVIVSWWSFGMPAVIPTPLQMLGTIGKMMDEKQLLQNVVSSLLLSVEAIAIATILSLLLAYASSLAAFKPVIKLVTLMRFLSLVGFSFIFTTIASGHALKLWMLTFSMTTYFATSTVAVINEIAPEKWDDARAQRMKPFRALLEVGILGTIDKMFEVLRQNAAIAWMMLTFVEGIVRSEGGIGSLLLVQDKFGKMEEIFMLQTIVMSIGLSMEFSIVWLKNVACPWTVKKGVK